MIEFDILRPQELPLLVAAAREDDHGVIQATHVIKKGDRYVGYIAFNSLPTVLVWLDTQRVLPRETWQVKNFYETLAAPFGGVCVPIPIKSPLHPYMERVGYQNMGDGTVFMKPL